MSAVSKDQILEAISGMTVLELSQLIKDMEEKFGVSAAAAAVAVAAPAAGGAAAPAAEEKTEFTVVLAAAGEKKVEVIFTDRLRKYLAKNGFDPLMGARPMQRLIQDVIRKALADELLFGKLQHGGKVSVDLDDKDEVQLNFSAADLPPPPPAADGEENVEVEPA